jgi:uncharacterized membrane protein
VKQPSSLSATDQGSTIPLVLGFFLIALVMVAGSVAAGDAFVQQSNLQSLCDGAAVAAASSADTTALRRPAELGSSLQLADVQQAVTTYLARDPARADIHIAARLSADATMVTTSCVVTETVAFGSFFGFGSGIEHHTTSSARSPFSQH